MAAKTFQIVLCLAILCFSYSKAIAETIKTQVNQQIIILHVQNMSCIMCKFTIKKTLQKNPAVHQVAIDLANKTVQIQFDADKTNNTALIKAVTHAGYPATERIVNDTLRRNIR